MKKKYQVQIGEETVNINICSLKCKNDCMANPARENLRDEQIIKSDYEVLHIKEKDYKNNKKEVVEQCINFLTQ